MIEPQICKYLVEMIKSLPKESHSLTVITLCNHGMRIFSDKDL